VMRRPKPSIIGLERIMLSVTLTSVDALAAAPVPFVT